MGPGTCPAALRGDRRRTRTQPMRAFQGRVLIAERDPLLGLLMAELVEGLALSATVCVRCDAAAALLRRESFDLVLVDSFSLLPQDALTAPAPVLHAAGRTPVVITSAHTLNGEAVRAAGFRDYLAKPF